MAVVFLTGEDADELNKQMEQVIGRLATLEKKFDTLLVELKEKLKTK